MPRPNKSISAKNITRKYEHFEIYNHTFTIVATLSKQYNVAYPLVQEKINWVEPRQFY